MIIHSVFFQSPWHLRDGELKVETILRCRDKQLAQLMQLVADCRSLFKFKILRMLHHLPFQLMNLLLQRFWRHIQFDNFRLRACA